MPPLKRLSARRSVRCHACACTPDDNDRTAWQSDGRRQWSGRALELGDVAVNCFTNNLALCSPAAFGNRSEDLAFLSRQIDLCALHQSNLSLWCIQIMYKRRKWKSSGGKRSPSAIWKLLRQRLAHRPLLVGQRFQFHRSSQRGHFRVFVHKYRSLLGRKSGDQGVS